MNERLRRKRQKKPTKFFFPSPLMRINGSVAYSSSGILMRSELLQKMTFKKTVVLQENKYLIVVSFIIALS